MKTTLYYFYSPHCRPGRRWHVSYTHSDKLLLLGGRDSGARKTGVELPGGRTFNLQHDAFSACLIPGEDFFVITGGHNENLQNYVDRSENKDLRYQTISRYSATGDFEKALPSLLQARSHHACAMYQDHTGDRVSYLYEDDMLNPNQFQS